MSSSALSLIEMLVSFGIVLALAGWELWSLRRDKSTRNDKSDKNDSAGS